jgi:hypothetical protein
MKSEFLSDGNYIGRLGAVVLIGLAFYGVHKVNCESGMCPVMKTDSCCSTPDAAHAPAPAAKPAAK